MSTEAARELAGDAAGRGAEVPAEGTLLTRHVRGLLYKEWLAHRNLIVGFWALWLICGPVLMLFHHPAWIFVLGMLYALLAAPAIAGMDAAEGSEEFAFSLPPTRGEIFLTRLALGGGNLLAMLAVSLLTIRLGLAQFLWGLVVRSGFTEPFPAASGNWYAFAVAAPVALFAFSFATAALQSSRATVGASWIPAALVAGLIAGGGLVCEYLLWKRITSGISCPLLVALSAGGLLLGYQMYLRKEGVSRPTPIGGRGRSWVWILVAVGIIVLGLGLLFFVWVNRATSEARPMPRSARSVGTRPPSPKSSGEDTEEVGPQHTSAGGEEQGEE